MPQTNDGAAAISEKQNIGNPKKKEENATSKIKIIRFHKDKEEKESKIEITFPKIKWNLLMKK